MLALLQRLDFWITIIVLGFAVMLEYDRIKRWWSGRPSVKRSEQRQGTVMSRPLRSEPVLSGSSTSADHPEKPQQHQLAPPAPVNFEDIIDYLSRHKLETSEQVVDVLSVLQFGDAHVLSANKIRDIAGGNEAAVKARVASHRPKAEPTPKAGARLERPSNGWAK